MPLPLRRRRPTERPVTAGHRRRPAPQACDPRRRRSGPRRSVAAVRVAPSRRRSPAIAAVARACAAAKLRRRAALPVLHVLVPEGAQVPARGAGSPVLDANEPVATASCGRGGAGPAAVPVAFLPALWVVVPLLVLLQLRAAAAHRRRRRRGAHSGAVRRRRPAPRRRGSGGGRHRRFRGCGLGLLAHLLQAVAPAEDEESPDDSPGGGRADGRLVRWCAHHRACLCATGRRR